MRRRASPRATICRVEVAARTAASKQPELAEKFLKFMVSPGFQNAIPTGNWMYPVTKVTLPAGFDTLGEAADHPVLYPAAGRQRASNLD